jgi:antitoxin component YwqK of YwqJK toxin-antitoxin module
MIRFQTSSKRWGWGLALTAGILIGGPATSVRAEATQDSAEAPAQLERLESDQSLPALQSVDLETVRERYPSRAIKIERQVVRDAEGNFVNHGAWQMWNERGQSMGRGQYRNGKREGVWLRTFQAGEAPMFSGAWGKMFEAPLLTSGTFVDGELHGVWAIVDSQERPVASWHYEHSQRNGKSVWYFPNGQKYREADYHDGQLDGKFTEWAADGSIVAEEMYVDGRRRGTQTEYFEADAKKAEAEYLFAREMVRTTEDWWAGVATTNVIAREGRDLKHGHYVTWYRNGQKAMEGEFREDQPVGKFVWWHPNGLRAIEGEYIGGKQGGRWSWWYESGKRFIQGGYQDGEQIGKWTWWTEAGAVAESSVYSIGSRGVAVTPVEEPTWHEPRTIPAPEAEPLESTERSAPKLSGAEGPLLLPTSGVESTPRFTLTAGSKAAESLSPVLFKPEPPQPPTKFRPAVRASQLRHESSR